MGQVLLQLYLSAEALLAKEWSSKVSADRGWGCLILSSFLSSSTNMSSAEIKTTARRNVRSFTLFRAFFSARFYYPVYALLFLDYGLTLGQFGILNGLWAVTIVLLEIPSRAR